MLILTIAIISVDNIATVENNTVLKITLAGNSCDRATPVKPINKLMGDADNQFAVNSVIKSIEKAKNDVRIPGIILECGGLNIGAAQAQSIRQALIDFRKSDKWVIAYGDTYSQTEYFISTAANSIILNTIGMVDIHGLSATTIYFKELLDKIGVKAQVVKVGTYKSAVEPFILDKMSDANRQQQEHFLNRIWSSITNTIADSRNVSPDSVNMWADSYAFTQKTDWYLNQNIVDRLMYKHQLEDYISIMLETDKLQTIEYDDYLGNVVDTGKRYADNKVNIAVLYAEGDITESASDGIASERLVPEILRLAELEHIDGLILRVNSGGGSAFASEQIWEALEQYKAISGKPFYVSMSNIAASGGYYISCGADKIFAEPLTLTGSIGIFGIIPEAQSLLNDKLGINTFTVATNSGGLPDFYKPMSAGQRAAMQKYVDNGYDLFLNRCAEGRNLSVEAIAEVAQGRVWDGTSALEYGLIDELGSLKDALEDMTAELEATDYAILEYPVITSNFWDQLLDMTSGSESYSAKLRNYLNAGVEFYDAINSFKSMSPLQCRMEYIIME
ncbi:MAG: signal peptide peptidase SppA [Paramuribaculum sp.]|nr:signal peptide peptidase SppA [Paramuribaculum sp.]